MKRAGQEGFSLLGVLIAVMIIGIVASIAVPKFQSAVVSANTAKVMADLTTLDTAIAVYQTETGKVPETISDLSVYVADLQNLKPPQGKCRLKDGSVTEFHETSYLLQKDSKTLLPSQDGCRAVCGGHPAGAFGR